MDTTEDGDTKWDVGAFGDAGPDGCEGGGGGGVEFSYLWVANSNEGTVSKIDTQTLKEVGEFDKVDGLDFPYTDSDMTGFALGNAGVLQG